MNLDKEGMLRTPSPIHFPRITPVALGPKKQNCFCVMRQLTLTAI